MQTLAAFVRRADEGTLSRLLVESSILLAASRENTITVLRNAATAYKVDTDAIASKVKQEFTAKERPRTEHKLSTKPKTKPEEKSAAA